MVAKTCYECGGNLRCWECEGSGERDGGRCSACTPNPGYCQICNGSGEVEAEPEERTAIVVGAFRELGYDGPTLVESAGQRGLDHLAEVVAYLRAGRLLVMSPGLVKDVFDGETLAGKRSTRTDGVYAWPDALAYFVERHRVPLPAAFERHMADRSWRVPAAIEIAGLIPRPLR